MRSASPTAGSSVEMNLSRPPQRSTKPVVLVPCDNRVYDDRPMQVLLTRYSDALRDQANVLTIPLLCTGKEDVEAYLALADGIMLTGSPSNVHPSHFGQDVYDPSLPLDPARDSITLPLIRRATALGMPLLAICRGLQEVNVALGGTLHQAVHEIDGRHDHRGAQGRRDVTTDEVYAIAHPVRAVAGGCLAAIIGSGDVMVNSVHGQGIDTLAPTLTVEGHAPDGQIEAVSIASHPGFSLAVQWHPEWKPRESEASLQIFSAFGDACRTWAARNRGESPVRNQTGELALANAA
jgi:putative glutamine amidotransferase